MALASAFVFLVVLLFASFAVLRSSTSALEFVLEEAVTRILNREFVIGELLEAELSWDSYLLARDVSLANPAWAKQPNFVSAARVLVRINIPSIWRDGPIVLTEVKLTDARLNLLSLEEHPANWNFWPDEVEEDAQEPQPQPEDSLEPIFPLHISKGHINGGELVYRDEQRDITLSIDELALRESADDALITLDLIGVLNELPLEMKGNVGPTVALLTWRDISMDLALSLGELEMKARGTIADIANFSGPDLHLKIAAPHFRPLLDMLGVAEIRDGPFSFDGHITDAHPGVSLDITGALDDLHIQLEGELADPLALDGVDIAFKLAGPSMADIGEVFELAGLPDQPYEVSGEVRRQGSDLTLSKGLFIVNEGRITIDGHLPEFPDINDWELNVESDGFNLEMLGPIVGAEGLPAIPYSIKGILSSTDEGVEVVDLLIQSPQSGLVLKGVVGEAPDYRGTRVRFELKGDDMADAGLWFGIHDLPTQAYQGAAELSLSEHGWSLNDAVFSTPDLKFGLNATIDKFPNPGRLDAKISFETENLERTVANYGFESAGLPAQAITVNGKLSGSPSNLKIDELIAMMADSDVRVSGVVGDPATLADLSLNVALQSPDLLSLLPDTEGGDLQKLPVDTRSHIVMTEQGLGIKEFHGTFGKATVDLKGLLNVEPPHENSHFTLNAKGPDLGKLLEPFLERDIPPTPFQLSLIADFKSGGIGVQKLEASAADARLSAHFDIKNLEELTGGQGEIKLSGSSIAKLAEMLGFEGSGADADYNFNVNIQQSPDALVLNPLSLQLGKGDVAGRVDIRLGDAPAFKVDLHSKFVSLPFLLLDKDELEKGDLAKAEESKESMQRDTLTKEELAERIIPDDPLDFSWLQNVQASIKYSADEIYISDEASSNTVIDISIVDGVLSSKQLSWGGTFIRGNADLTVRLLDEGAEIETYLDVQRLPLMLMLGGEPKYDPDTLYRAHVKTSGNSLRELAKNSNGAIVFKGGGGRLDNQGLDLIMGDTLDEILTRINPFSESDKNTHIICHAGAMAVENGKVSMDPGIVIRLSKMDMAVGGVVDLHREKLDIVFNSKSRKGLGLNLGKAVTPYFKVGGTMANPRLVVDPKGVALSGGAAVATAGLSILAEGLWDRWIATSKNPCEGLVGKLRKQKNRAYSDLLALPQ